MRDYAKITPQFWIGQTGKQIRQLGIEAQLVALYLITSPHANMLGVYYLPIIFIAHETGITLEGASKSLQALCKVGFCSYDRHTEHVWVREMAFYQIGEQLKHTDNRVKNINEAYNSLPNLPFLNDFYEKYHEALLLETARKNVSSFEVPSKPLGSQEQEQEQDQEQEQEQEQESEGRTCATSLCEVAPAENSIIKIPLKNHAEFSIHNALIDEWQLLYPAVDVLQTLRHICGWNQANLQRRKTKSGILKHIHGWLAKEQDKQAYQQLKPKQSNMLYDHNKIIAQEWAIDPFTIDTGEVDQ